jgi:hypothetical protein
MIQSELPVGDHGAFIKIDPQMNSLKITVVPLWKGADSVWITLPSGRTMASEHLDHNRAAFEAIATDATGTSYQPSVANADGLFKFLPECEPSATTEALKSNYQCAKVKNYLVLR